MKNSSEKCSLVTLMAHPEIPARARAAIEWKRRHRKIAKPRYFFENGYNENCKRLSDTERRFCCCVWVNLNRERYEKDASLLVEEHCCSREHVANLFDVSIKELLPKNINKNLLIAVVFGLKIK